MGRVEARPKFYYVDFLLDITFVLLFIVCIRFERKGDYMIADVAGYYGILACCMLGDGAGDGGAAGTHKGIFGWKVQHDAADSVAQSGKEPLPPRLPSPYPPQCSHPGGGGTG